MSSIERAAHRVLVTEGQDVLSLNIILQLLERGYAVGAIVQSSPQEEMLRKFIHTRLSARLISARFTIVRWNFFIGPITALRLWEYSFIIHNLEATFRYRGKDDDIGTRTIEFLRAADEAGVERTIVASSFDTVGSGEPSRTQAYTESDWTDTARPRLSESVRQRTLAERRIWNAYRTQIDSMSLCVINAVDICGPVPRECSSVSVMAVRRILDGSLTRLPQLFFGMIDVRDLANLLLKAMLCPTVSGERYLASATSQFIDLRWVAEVIRSHSPLHGTGTSIRTIPNVLVRLATLRDPVLRGFLDEHLIQKELDLSKVRATFGFEPRSVVESIIATVDSLLQRSYHLSC